MSDDQTLRLFGTYGSPYTRKMLSLLRFRRIPYQLLQGGHGDADSDLPKPKVELLPIFYVYNDDQQLEATVDSTPFIRHLEQRSTDRSVLPTDPALEFVDYLLEDYGDEWLTKAMFHYRWAFDEDADKASTQLPLEHKPTLAESQRLELKALFRDRQVPRLRFVGSNPITAEVIESSYQDFLRAFERILQSRPFLLGDRPSAADFAFFGQLTQLTQFDPTSMRVSLQTAPRVCGWVCYMDDLSGQSVDDCSWLDRNEALASLKPLLTEIGRSYVPVMLANAAALDSGAQTVQTEVNGKPWEQNPFPYQRRCLQWLREKYVALATDDRQWVDHLLADTGCEALFQDQ